LLLPNKISQNCGEQELLPVRSFFLQVVIDCERLRIAYETLYRNMARRILAQEKLTLILDNL
jgi:hypothetical protein